MRKLYINEDTYPENFPCIIYSWEKNKDGQKTFVTSPTYRDERGDEYCKELEKHPDFIGWCKNPWTGEVLLTDEEMAMFEKVINPLYSSFFSINKTVYE